MICTVATFVQYSQHLLDKIFHVRRAGPDIEDGPNAFAGTQVLVHGAEKTIFAAAIDPRGAEDKTSITSAANGFLAPNLFSTDFINWPRFVFVLFPVPASNHPRQAALRA